MRKLITGVLTGTTRPFRDAEGRYNGSLVWDYKPYKYRSDEHKRRGYWLTAGVVCGNSLINVDATNLDLAAVYLFYAQIKRRGTRWKIKIQ